jgi:hypothetical protein
MPLKITLVSFIYLCMNLLHIAALFYHRLDYLPLNTDLTVYANKKRRTGVRCFM